MEGDTMSARFIRRTWRRTSEKICLANDIPPGFRIVLLDEDGRVKRDDLLVRSGGFAGYPVSFPVWHFLEMAIHDHVKDADRLDYAAVQLRNHRDEPVDPSLTLRRVRDMPGTGDGHADDWWDKHDRISEIEDEIANALAIFDDDWRLLGDVQDSGGGRDEGAARSELLLKALIRYIISRFNIDALEHVLEFYKVDIERVRSVRG
jgi:hypothetical protein